jgi:hypothetical protein
MAKLAVLNKKLITEKQVPQKFQIFVRNSKML